jgi:hypothetical protein
MIPELVLSVGPFVLARVALYRRPGLSRPRVKPDCGLRTSFGGRLMVGEATFILIGLSCGMVYQRIRTTFIVEGTTMETKSLPQTDRRTVRARVSRVNLTHSKRPLPAVSAAVRRNTQQEARFMRAVMREVGRLARHNCLTWECQAARRLRSIDSYGVVLNLLRDPEVNVRIFVADVIGRCGYLASKKGQAQLRRRLRGLLKDDTVNDYEYGAFQLEEESSTTVARTASAALIALDCATHARKVLK